MPPASPTTATLLRSKTEPSDSAAPC